MKISMPALAKKFKGIFMVRILFVIVLILAIVAGIGYYRGWLHVSSNSDNNNTQVTVSVDKDRMQEDKDKAVNKVEDLGQQAKDKVAPTTH
jgi:hypothetical protein